jgi:hypothetical protein
MLIPDISFNPSAGIRNDNLGDFADFSHHTGGYVGNKPLATTRCLQLNIKEVFISKTKESSPSPDTLLVTVVIDNRAVEPIRLRIASLGKAHPNQYMSLPASGLQAYRQSPNCRPTFLDYRILIIEARQGLPDLPTLYNRILHAPKCISVRDILTNVSLVALPSSSLIGVASDIVLNLAARTINPEESAQLLYVRGNFDKKVDDMGIRYGLISQGNDYASVKYQVEKTF